MAGSGNNYAGPPTGSASITVLYGDHTSAALDQKSSQLSGKRETNSSNALRDLAFTEMWNAGEKGIVICHILGLTHDNARRIRRKLNLKPRIKKPYLTPRQLAVAAEGWLDGFDTASLAKHLKTSEAAVANSLHAWREEGEQQ